MKRIRWQVASGKQKLGFEADGRQGEILVADNGSTGFLLSTLSLVIWRPRPLPYSNEDEHANACAKLARVQNGA